MLGSVSTHDIFLTKPDLYMYNALLELVIIVHCSLNPHYFHLSGITTNRDFGQMYKGPTGLGWKPRPCQKPR